MSDKGIVLRLNGTEYNVAPPFTNRELHIIKQVSGLRAGELWEGFEAGDQALFVALTYIGVRRTGAASPTLDELWDLEADAITLAADEEEIADAADPTPPAPGSGSRGTSRAKSGGRSTAKSST